MSSKTKTVLKLMIPSLIGIILFLVPVNYRGESEIVVGIIANGLKSALGGALIPLLTVLTVGSAALSLLHRICPLPFFSRHEALNRLFSPNLFWLVVRTLGGAITLLVFFRVGPAAVWSADTGGNMLTTILPSCAVWYLVGGLLLPLMTDYGLLDIFSSLFKRVSRPLFKVPGRAMLDCVTSWVGSSVCGIYLTISQYEGGFYNAREAAIISSNFSLLSISFCSMIAAMLGLGTMFGRFYLTIVAAGVICAVITPRLWPLRGIPETYDAVSGRQVDEEAPRNMSNLRWGYRQALKRAEAAPGFLEFLKKGVTTAADLTLNTMPVIMAFGTIALIVANYTPVFDYLGVPLGLYLKVFGVPDAMEAGSAILVGFADQFIPVVIGSAFSSLFTRFVVGCCCILQILYITDIGALVLTSRMPFNLWQMFVVFLERIVISIPIIVLCANLFGIA